MTGLMKIVDDSISKGHKRTAIQKTELAIPGRGREAIVGTKMVPKYDYLGGIYHILVPFAQVHFATIWSPSPENVFNTPIECFYRAYQGFIRFLLLHEGSMDGQSMVVSPKS